VRVLLTGANGFIGAHLTAALLAAGHQVVAAVRRVLVQMILAEER
jgi:uncharacterized protein YbjT (DUF2867 family)